MIYQFISIIIVGIFLTVYFFPKNSFIENVDVSGVKIDLSRILRGGIGYGGAGSKLLAQGMETIGSSDLVTNLPFCIEGVIYSNYKNVVLVDTNNYEVKEKGLEALRQEVRRRRNISLPINLNGHTSLLHIAFENAFLRVNFFDSLELTQCQYKERYDSISGFVKDFLHVEFSSYRVYHLLDQGDPETSNGCGYFSLYTALLLKDASVEELVEKYKAKGTYLFFDKDDVRIRAEMVVRTVLFTHIHKEDLDEPWSFSFEKSIAHMVDLIPLAHTIEQLRNRTLN